MSEPSIINRLRLEYVTCFRQLKRSGLEIKDGQDSADGDGSLTGATLHLVGFCRIAQSSCDTIQSNQSKSKIPFQTR